jgi:pyruvate, orthophosphate dikinase
MIPLVGFKKELDCRSPSSTRRQGGAGREEGEAQLLRRHHDRNPARRADGRRDRQDAEFFSFGTNDLTQTCLGMSRDDSGSFLPPTRRLEIIKKNPFATIDQTGVGQLMKIAVEKAARPGPTSSSASAASTAATRTA